MERNSTGLPGIIHHRKGMAVILRERDLLERNPVNQALAAVIVADLKPPPPKLFVPVDAVEQFVDGSHGFVDVGGGTALYGSPSLMKCRKLPRSTFSRLNWERIKLATVTDEKHTTNPTGLRAHSGRKVPKPGAGPIAPFAAP